MWEPAHASGKVVLDPGVDGGDQLPFGHAVNGVKDVIPVSPQIPGSVPEFPYKGGGPAFTGVLAAHAGQVGRLDGTPCGGEEAKEHLPPPNTALFCVGRAEGCGGSRGKIRCLSGPPVGDAV